MQRPKGRINPIVSHLFVDGKSVWEIPSWSFPMARVSREQV